MFRKSTAAAVLIAMSMASMPAYAQFQPGPPPGGGGGGGGFGRGGGFGGGGFGGGGNGGEEHRRHGSGIDGGSLVLGAILAGGLIAVLSAKHRQPGPPPPPQPSPEDEAANICADAVEANLRDEGVRDARVQNIDDVQPRDRGFLVRGEVSLGNRGPRGDVRRFSCNVGGHGVRSLTIL